MIVFYSHASSPHIRVKGSLSHFYMTSKLSSGLRRRAVTIKMRHSPTGPIDVVAVGRTTKVNSRNRCAHRQQAAKFCHGAKRLSPATLPSLRCQAPFGSEVLPAVAPTLLLSLLSPATLPSLRSLRCQAAQAPFGSEVLPAVAALRSPATYRSMGC